MSGRSGTMRFLAAATGILMALLPQSGALAEQADSVHTEEVGCYEFGETVLVPIAGLRAALPTDYTPRPSRLDPNVGAILIIDYACDSLTVDGYTWPNRTAVTMGFAYVLPPDGVPLPTPYYILWHGTNNPHLANALRKLGVDSHTLSMTDSVTPVDATRSRVQMSFRGWGMDHEQDALALEPSGQVAGSVSGRFYQRGDRGDVLLTYVNRSLPTSTASVELSVDPGSLIAGFGVPTTSTRNAAFVRGEWDGTAALQ